MSLGLGAWGGDPRPAITLGPASAFPVPRITSKKFLPVKRRYLTEREVERLIEAAKSNRHGASHIARMNIGPLRSLLPLPADRIAPARSIPAAVTIRMEKGEVR